MNVPTYTLTPTQRVWVACLAQAQAATATECDAIKKAAAMLVANIHQATLISPAVLREIERRAEELERLRRPKPLEVVL